MDSTTLLALALSCAPTVHPDTVSALVRTESALNPNAIGVVGGSLIRQPRSREEAVATAMVLRDGGRNFSVGLSQINVHNFARFGIDLESAFDPCTNLRAMQQILGECASRAQRGDGEQHRLRRALSCYYSGNFSTGYRDGYVTRVVGAALNTTPAHKVTSLTSLP